MLSRSAFSAMTKAHDFLMRVRNEMHWAERPYSDQLTLRLQGIVATLKIPDWSRTAELPAWLAAFRDWGFAPRARQLSSGGREICVVARRVTRTPGARSATKARPASSRRPLRSPRARSRPAE